MENKYILTEEQLIRLLAARHKLNALEMGGVDNWIWYGESLYQYSKNYENDFEDEDFDFEDIAKLHLPFYTLFRGNS